MKKSLPMIILLMIVLSMTFGTTTTKAKEQTTTITMRLEAEDALRYNTVLNDYSKLASNGRMLKSFDFYMDSVTFENIPADSKGLIIGYTRGNDSPGRLTLYIDDCYEQVIEFPCTGGWGDKAGDYGEYFLDLDFSAGSNIKFQFNNGDADIRLDYIDLNTKAGATTPAPVEKNSRLVQARFYIIKQMHDFPFLIDVSKYKLQGYEIDAIRKSITINSAPSLFYVMGIAAGSIDKCFEVYKNTSESTPDGRKTYVSQIMPVYGTSKDRSMRDLYEAAVKKMIDSIPKDASDVDKVVLVNDYIASISTYSKSIDFKYESRGIFLNGGGVCNGYALAFIDGMNRFEIESKYVASRDMDHGWVMVKIDNEWYHVDPTWDDTTNRWHKYCLASDSEIVRLGHYNWSSEGTTPKATSTKYDNADWKTSNDYIKLNTAKPSEFGTIATGKLKFEAEDAVYAGGARYRVVKGASENSLVTDVAKGGGSVTFIKVPKANGITVRYTRGDIGDGVVSVYINGEYNRDICFPSTRGSETNNIYLKEIHLEFDIPEGADISFRGNDFGGTINMDCMYLYVKETLPPQIKTSKATKYTTLKSGKLRFEGENAVFTGDARVYANYPKASKGKVAAYIIFVGDSATFVKTPKAKGFTIRYTRGGEDSGKLSLYINGVHKKDITFPNTGGYGVNSSEYKTLTVNIDIPKGANIMFKVDDDDKSVNIDYIDLIVSK